MLARLDEIPGVDESRVDWTGRRFLLRLEPDARAQLVGPRAQEALGEGAFVLSEDETRSALDARQRGEAWMRAGETLRLSHYEAKVLAERYGGEAASRIGLDAEATGKLVDLFERELALAFERTHEATGSVDIPARVGEAIERIAAASADFLDADQRDALVEYLGEFR